MALIGTYLSELERIIEHRKTEFERNNGVEVKIIKEIRFGDVVLIITRSSNNQTGFTLVFHHGHSHFTEKCYVSCPKWHLETLTENQCQFILVNFPTIYNNIQNANINGTEIKF